MKFSHLLEEAVPAEYKLQQILMKVDYADLFLEYNESTFFFCLGGNWESAEQKWLLEVLVILSIRIMTSET